MGDHKLMNWRIRWHGVRLEELLGLLPFLPEAPDLVPEGRDAERFAGAFTPWEGRRESFGRILQAGRALHRLDIPIHSPRRDGLRGALVAAEKYDFVLKKVLRGLGMEDMLHLSHLPYLAEARSDLKASFLLLRYQRTKLALQALRNALELGVAHLHYANQGMAFMEMPSDTEFRMARFTGSKGMLETLRLQGWIHTEEQMELTHVYRRLSREVHPSPGQLTGHRSGVELLEMWAQEAQIVGCAILTLILRMLACGI